jgi:hypothetical protein
MRARIAVRAARVCHVRILAGHVIAGLSVARVWAPREAGVIFDSCLFPEPRFSCSSPWPTVREENAAGSPVSASLLMGPRFGLQQNRSVLRLHCSANDRMHASAKIAILCHLCRCAKAETAD